MKKILAIALLLSPFAATAPAAAFDVRTVCSRSAGSFACRTWTLEAPRQLTAEEVAERDARDAKWLEFCQPKRTVDELGMTRLVYAHPGCEHGRTE